MRDRYALSLMRGGVKMKNTISGRSSCSRCIWCLICGSSSLIVLFICQPIGNAPVIMNRKANSSIVALSACMPHASSM